MQVGADLGRDDLAGRQRGAVMDGDDADQVLIGGEDDRREAVAIGDRLLHAVEHALFLLTQAHGRRPARR